MIISSLIDSIYNLVDTLFVSQIGIHATAAVAMPAVPEPTQEADEAARQREALSKYYTIDEVKAILRIVTTSVYNLFKRKKLTKYKVLGKTVVLKEELDNAVECQEVCRYKHGR